MKHFFNVSQTIDSRSLEFFNIFCLFFVLFRFRSRFHLVRICPKYLKGRLNTGKSHLYYLPYWISVTQTYDFFSNRFSITKTSGASQARMWLLIDEVRKTFSDMDFHEQGSGSSSPTGAFTINMQLTAGQIVRVENEASTFIYGTTESGVMQSWFTGYMLYSL